MNDRPTAPELIDAVRRFLEAELLPALTDARLRFQTLVAANTLSVAGRELETEQKVLREEWSSLREVLGEAEIPGDLNSLRRAVREGNEQLCTRIRAGEFDGPDGLARLMPILRRTVRMKLEVANPRFRL